MLRNVLIAACLGALCAMPAFAQPAGPEESGPEAPGSLEQDEAGEVAVAEYSEAEIAEMIAEFEASLDEQTGTIKLPGANVTLTVSPEFYFLDVEDARKVLEEGWGNPPDANIAGMLFPAGRSPLDEVVWGVVVRYENTGYVSDEDAASIDYDMLAAEMRDQIEMENAQRKREGYETIDFVGWAAKPRYDDSTHKLYWAKELAFEDQPVHTLNYDMRVLGRHGVLSLNFVASVDQLPEIETASPAVLAIPEFDSGFRYKDFNAATDAKADFGVAGLIGGAAAAAALAKNGGILAAVLLFLKKGWVLIFAAVAGIGALIRGLFGRKPEPQAQSEQRASTAFFDEPAAPDPTPSPPSETPPSSTT